MGQRDTVGGTSRAHTNGSTHRKNTGLNKEILLENMSVDRMGWVRNR
jgi:hypothetical protein